MLVYRFLRKISDWTMAGFYSEVYVGGEENVPKDGPIILAATHHNEIIDIAALSVTIPHRRRICYWAKSTLFKNPLCGALLRSSGSIPVYRNPNNIGANGSSGASRSGSPTMSHADLFRHTTAALGRGEVIGVFPEGTSYTEPAIAQIKEGAAWAAVEYARARARGEPGRDLIIVPAAVVYTDKSQYQSQVIVLYGEPIRVDDFLAGVALDDGDSVRGAVKTITGEIYRRLKEMTVNAPDWDTYNGAKMATALGGGHLGKHLRRSQLLVELLSGNDERTRNAKRSLVKYLGLLYYTGISPAALEYLYPLPEATPLTVRTAFFIMLVQLSKTFLHPNAILFLPIFVFHLPMYVSGWLAARFLTQRDEEESKAQFKAIFGGLGAGLSYGVIIRLVFKALDEERLDQKLIGTAIVTIGAVITSWKIHNFLVKGNLERWRRLSASIKILVGISLPTSNDLSEEGLVSYSRPPPPAENPFIKRASAKFVNPPAINMTKLIRPLLVARVDAVDAVRVLVGEGRDERREFPNRADD